MRLHRGLALRAAAVGSIAVLSLAAPACGGDDGADVRELEGGTEGTGTGTGSVTGTGTGTGGGSGTGTGTGTESPAP